MGITAALDRDTVQEKIRHYEGVVSRYRSKYSATYEEYMERVSGSGLTAEVEDDLLDWKEALLMLGVYEKLLGGLGKPG